MKEIILQQDTLLSVDGCLQFIPPTPDEQEFIINNMLVFLEDIFQELHYKNKLALKNLDTTNSNIEKPSDKICLEIRPLMRRYPLPSARIPKYDEIYIKQPSFKAENFRLFSFSEQQKKAFSTYIKRLFKKKVYFCLYYSVYTFDHSIITAKRNGEPYPVYKNMISGQNAFETQRLVCDFDDITEQEFLDVYKNLTDIGLEPSITIFSGHGFQCIYKLNKPCGDLHLLSKFTNYLLYMKFPVDNHIKDAPRIMRMPFCWNNKEYGKKELVWNQGAHSIYTYIYNQSGIIYNLDDITRQITISNQKNILPVVKESSCKIPELIPYELSAEPKDIKINTEAKSFLEKHYPMLFLDAMDDTVLKMLLGFQKKEANNMLMFIISYLREHGYSLEIIINVIDVLKGLNTFSYSWDDLETEACVKRIYYNYCDSPSYFLYDKNGLSIFGDFKLDSNENCLNIYNFILESFDYYKITGIYIYITMLYWNNITLQSRFTAKELANLTGLSTRSIYRDLEPLVRKSNVLYQALYLVDKSATKHCYYKSAIRSPLESRGFFTMKYDSIDKLIELVKAKTICPTAFVIALILKKYSFGTQSVFLSQNEIAKMLNFRTQGTISREIQQLAALDLLEISTKQISSIQVKNEYFLKY